MLRKIFLGYSTLDRPILALIFSGLAINFINSAFNILLPFYLTKVGYSDYQFAQFVSSRFFAVMIFAFPLGLFIKGRPLIPLFLIGTGTIPIASLGIIYSVAFHADHWIYFFTMIWGLGFLFFNVGVIPFILRYGQQTNHSEAIALNFSTWGMSQCLCGLIAFGLQKINPVLFDEKFLLIFFALVSFLGFYLILNIKVTEPKRSVVPGKKFLDLHEYDWKRIGKVIVPNLMIAIGAGLTIPFMPLFFYNVFGIDSEIFALFGSISAVLVSLGAILVPTIKKRFGYTIAIIFTQTLAILALVFLATTELYPTWNFAMYIAIFCYILRQPLMNMAGPMTSELGMYYVGERNREMISALHSSIWSGSWFCSSQIFSVLRKWEMPYYLIFLITAFFYGLGVFFYYLLIRDYQKVVPIDEIKP